MRTILVITFMIFATHSSGASHSRFQGEKQPNPTYSECAKAMEKGVLVGVTDKGYRVFFYKDHLYTIFAQHHIIVCLSARFD